MKNKEILCISLILLCIACQKTSNKHELENGKPWKDTDGNFINAHGGCILHHNGVYYWYGEYKGNYTYRLDYVKTWECWRSDAGGVSCYSSVNLTDWKFEGIVLPTSSDSASELNPSQVIERPKVIYNEKTKKFVMWMHIESPDYEKAHAGVAVSDNPTGKFTYLGSCRPNGLDSRDQTVFKDDDGKAYQIYSSDWNKTTIISLLSDDYLRQTGRFTRIFINSSREAPAVFKHNGKYYMITSGCTGWDPNSALYAIADSMFGKWQMMNNPCRGKNAGKTFLAQSTFVLPVDGKPGIFIAMFDKWEKTDLKNSTYIWLPVDFKEEKPIITWRDKWSVDNITK
jgi:beta-galactosidase